MMNYKKYWDWFNNYLNGKLFRDCRYICGDVATKYDSDSKEIIVKSLNETHKLKMNNFIRYNKSKNKIPTLESKKIFKRFMQNRKHHDGRGNLTYQLNHYKTVEDYLGNDNPICDRLFIDFDIHDDTVNTIKDYLKFAKLGKYPSWYDSDDKVIVEFYDSESDKTFEREYLKGKQRLNVEKECRLRYNNYITSDDFLLEAYNELMLVCEYLKERGAIPIPIYTGGAGFHLNILFDDSTFINATNLSNGYASLLVNKLGLKLVDSAVSRNVYSQVQRTPFSVHNNSNKRGFVFSIEDEFDDVMSWFIKGNAPIDTFNFEEHTSHPIFLENLHNVDVNLNNIELKKKEIKNQNIKNNYKFKTDSNDFDIRNMRILWNYFVSKNLVKPKDKELEYYDRVLCPFHDDTNSSAIISIGGFTCYGCGYVDDNKLNYFEFIRKLYNLKSDNEVKVKLKEIITELR